MINILEHTKNIYGNLDGVENQYFFEDGAIMGCMLSGKNIIRTNYGDLIPKYTLEEDSVRRKYTNSISFYKNGTIKSISLEEQTNISTSIGTFPAEFVTFYESGALKRIFPLNGKLSGYWSEEEEENLCKTFEFRFPFGNFLSKIINLNFYENGSVRAITLWPKETICIDTKLGQLSVRTGISLYEDGSIKTIEPAYNTLLPTPIGDIYAYNINSLGVCGDNNSLAFNKDGSIYSLITSNSNIIITNSDGTQEILKPTSRPDPFIEGHFISVPIKISFKSDYVKFETNTVRVYDINKTIFSIENTSLTAEATVYSCGDCSKCSLCK